MDFSNSAVTFIVDKHAKTPVRLVSTRSRAIAQACMGQTPEAARVILRSLLGLCPVAQTFALDSAVAVLGTEFSSRTSQARSKLVAVEAILETLRVLSLDLKSLVSRAHVSDPSLKTLGALRAKLWRLSGSTPFDTEAALALYEEAEALAMLWLTREKKTIGAIKTAYDRFEELKLTGDRLLFPDELKSEASLKFLLAQLTDEPAFALAPRLLGCRIPGALARIRSSIQGPAARSEFTVKDLIVARFVELRHVAAGQTPAYGCQAIKLDSHTSVGMAETARGTLLHFVRLKNGGIEAMHIVAPTEWSFQVGSPMLHVMNQYVSTKLSAPKSTESGLKLIAAAFDACTPLFVQWDKGGQHA